MTMQCPVSTIILEMTKKKNTKKVVGIDGCVYGISHDIYKYDPINESTFFFCFYLGGMIHMLVAMEVVVLWEEIAAYLRSLSYGETLKLHQLFSKQK